MYIDSNRNIELTSSNFFLFEIDNHTNLGINNGAERHVTDYTVMLSIDTFIPLICYTVLWYSVNLAVTTHCWTTWQEGIRRKRLVNVTTSLIHSSVSGVFLFVYFIRNTQIMFSSPMHYYSYSDSQIVMLSIGYFIYDACDLLVNDRISIATCVLLFHHIASVYVLSTAIASKKFLLYAYWALLMEVSSIFLHSRSLLHISKLSATSMIAVSKAIGYMNIIAFIIFRFGVQFFLIGWAYVNMDNMHIYYVWIAMGGGGIFLVINIGLFLRILHSDGLLCSSVVSHERLDALLEDNEYKSGKLEKKELLIN
uniref:TLC domain-containing protein n=1 Tax=Heterorhabditis bacteriophora TaxID=37862 RepID=A0A1I7XCM4_HETBA